MKPDDLDAVFASLASEPRRRILDVLKKEPGCNVNRVCDFFDDMGRVAVMKHLDVLDEAGLISRTKAGRTVTVRLRPEPMREAMEWLQRYERFWSASLDRLKMLAEAQERSARRAEAKPDGDA